MGLLNVRLSDEDENAVRALRAQGVSISEVVRGAIRAEALKARATKVDDVQHVLGDMVKLFPSTADVDSVPHSVASDRRKMQTVIRERLKRSR
jgi:hypothetical protein